MVAACVEASLFFRRSWSNEHREENRNLITGNITIFLNEYGTEASVNSEYNKVNLVMFLMARVC